MLHGAQLPKHLWGEALAHAVWLKNCTSTKALEPTTPLEALTSTKPNLSDLHEWGRRVLVYDQSNSKLGSRVKEGRWVRFDTESKASHVYWLDKHTVSVERDTKFERDHVLVQPTKSPSDPVPAEATTQINDSELPPMVEAEVGPQSNGHVPVPKRGAHTKHPSQYIHRICAGEGT